MQFSEDLIKPLQYEKKTLHCSVFLMEIVLIGTTGTKHLWAKIYQVGAVDRRVGSRPSESSQYANAMLQQPNAQRRRGVHSNNNSETGKYRNKVTIED